MLIKIQYTNGNYDFIKTYLLDRFIDQGIIGRFYRPISKQWVSSNDNQADIRNNSNNTPYQGIERRDQ